MQSLKDRMESLYCHAKPDIAGTFFKGVLWLEEHLQCSLQ